MDVFYYHPARLAVYINRTILPATGFTLSPALYWGLGMALRTGFHKKFIFVKALSCQHPAFALSKWKEYNSSMPQQKNPIVIGIAGGTGSGKTTVANAILKGVGANRIAFLAHDAYYRELSHLSIEERRQVNFDHPDSLETELLVQHIHQLKNWQPVELPVYDFTRHSRTDRTIHIEPHPVILVEGILIFYEPELRPLFDVKIFVDTDADLRFIRRLQRDIIERGRTTDSVVQQYLNTVRPMHLEFVEPSKRYADVIIPEGGLNTVALDMVIARIEALLQGEKHSI